MAGLFQPRLALTPINPALSRVLNLIRQSYTDAAPSLVGLGSVDDRRCLCRVDDGDRLCHRLWPDHGSAPALRIRHKLREQKWALKRPEHVRRRNSPRRLELAKSGSGSAVPSPTCKTPVSRPARVVSSGIEGKRRGQTVADVKTASTNHV